MGTGRWVTAWAYIVAALERRDRNRSPVVHIWKQFGGNAGAVLGADISWSDCEPRFVLRWICPTRLRNLTLDGIPKIAFS